MKKILVLGGTGMLGHMVRRVLGDSTSLEVHGTAPYDGSDAFWFDAEKGMESLSRICDRSGGYDYFINCIGMLAAGIRQDQPSSVRRAIVLNTLLPRELWAFARPRGIRVIHISTDGVFQGNGGPYDEDGVHDCEDFYGITKSLGEVKGEGFLNLRCSIIGPSPFEGKGLLQWFLGQPEGSAVPGFTDQVWHGVSTLQFALLCRTIIETDRFDALRSESPVFHFAPNEPVRKCDLLRLFAEAFEKPVEVRDAESGGKGFKRILKTKFKGLRDIYPHGLTAREMVQELAQYVKSNQKETNRE